MRENLTAMAAIVTWKLQWNVVAGTTICIGSHHARLPIQTYGTDVNNTDVMTPMVGPWHETGIIQKF